MDLILVVFFFFYIMPCVALIAILWWDSQPSKNTLQIGNIAYSPQLEELPTTDRTAEPREKEVIPPSRIEEFAARSSLRESKYEFSGTRGRILLAYKSALEVMGKAGIKVSQHSTLRECLKSIESTSPTAIKSFADLTILAEIALYSAIEPDENMIIIAEQLAAIIKES